MVAATQMGAFFTDVHVVRQENWGQVKAFEIVGTGYTAGGQELPNKKVVQDSINNLAIFAADDLVWKGSTIKARYLVLYKDAADDLNKKLLCFFDLGDNLGSQEGDFKISWNAQGIINFN